MQSPVAGITCQTTVKAVVWLCHTLAETFHTSAAHSWRVLCVDTVSGYVYMHVVLHLQRLFAPHHSGHSRHSSQNFGSANQQALHTCRLCCTDILGLSETGVIQLVASRLADVVIYLSWHMHELAL